VGLDLGQRRIGVAMTAAGGRLALPYRVLERSGDAARDRSAVAAIVDELEAEIVVVGLPLSLSGRMGQAAHEAAAEAASLGDALGVPVVTFDERLTTVEAARRRREHEEITRARPGAPREGKRGFDGSRRRRSRAGPVVGGSSAPRRPVLDAQAAAIMLEAWLGAQR
jgi:putative Holliday junction resolvase